MCTTLQTDRGMKLFNVEGSNTSVP